MKKLIFALSIFAFCCFVTHVSAQECRILVQGLDADFTKNIVEQMIPDGHTCQVLTSTDGVSGNVYVVAYGEAKMALLVNLNIPVDMTNTDYLFVNQKSAYLYPVL